MTQSKNPKSTHRTRNRNGDASGSKPGLKTRVNKPLPPTPAQSKSGSKRDDHIADLTAAYQASSDFQTNNQNSISNAASALASSAEVKEIEQKVKDFASSSKVLMDVLDEVRRIHPVIDVVVLAFKAVVTLQLKRQDNDQKVIVLQVKMHDMMETFVQLGAITPEKKEPDRNFTVEESLKRICARISDDIWSCANLCDSYSKKRLLVKLLKSPIYDARLAGYIQTFVERRNELDSALGMFNAHKIHSTLSLLEANQQALNTIAESVKVIFEKLRAQTPLEQQLWRVIEDRGGVEECTSDEDALRELLIVASHGRNPLRENTVAEDSPYTTMNPLQTSSARFHPSVSQPRTGVYPYERHATPMYYGGISQEHGRPEPEAEAPYHTPYSTSRHPLSGPASRTPYVNSVNTAGFPRHTPPTVPPIPNTQSSHRPTTAYVPPFDITQTLPTQYPSGYAPASYGPILEHEPERLYPRATPTRPYDYGSDRDPRAPDPPEPLIYLKQELQLDVDDDLKKNMLVFSKKLDEQRRQLKQIEDAVVLQGNRVITAIREGPHDRIYDPELRAIWKEMGWKLGVPAQEFVLTLHDYYVAQHSDTNLLDNHLKNPALLGSTAEDQTVILRKAFSAAKQRAAEMWALKHINMTNFVPLMEVFDGDASGSVSVWEANQVASLRPKDWNFLQWLAYWAAGRHFTIWEYRRKIGAIILDMFQVLEVLLPTNRAIVDQYLLNMPNVEQILGCITPCSEQPEGIFAEKIVAYTLTEEDIMKKKLNALDYQIDAPDALGLIISESQIERNLLPLLYLLLKHHSAIIQAGTRIVFDREELFAAIETLHQIFDAIHIRIRNLEYLITSSHFNSHYSSIEEQFDRFAFGMYSNVFHGFFYSTGLSRSDYDIAETKTDVLDQKSNANIKTKYPSPTIFPDKPVSYPANLNEYITRTGVEGFWTGYFFDKNDIPVHGMIEFEVQAWRFSDEIFQGSGSYSQGTITIDGTIKIHRRQGSVGALLRARPDYRKDEKYDLFLRGTLSIDRDLSSRGSVGQNPRSLPSQYTISGEWGYTSDMTRVHGRCYFSQTPGWARYFKSRIVAVNVRGRPTRARSLWQFAYDAIMHQVFAQKGLLRTKIVREMFVHLRRGAELSRYQYLLDKQPLNARDQQEMNNLLLISTPWNSRFYRSIARVQFHWATLHYDSRCTVCESIILGNHFQCYNCATYDNFCYFCSKCRDYHEENPTKGHSLIKRKRFNHHRDKSDDKYLYRDPGLDDLSNRPYQFRPPFATTIVVPHSSSSGRHSPIVIPGSHGTPIIIQRSPTPTTNDDHGSKRVRFSLNALRSSSRMNRKKHTRSPSWPGPIIPEPYSPNFNSFTRRDNPPTPVIQYPHDLTDETAVDDLERDGAVMRKQCVSCSEVVDLATDVYWSCIICSDVSIHKYVVVCSKCELKDRPLPDGEEEHKLEHPIIRVRVPPDTWHERWPVIVDNGASKRGAALKFIKGLFKSTEKHISADDSDEWASPWDSFR